MFRCIHPYSAVFTVIFSVVFTRCSEDAAHNTVFPPSCRRTQHVGSLASMRSGLTHTLETVLSQALARDVLHTFYEPSRNLLGAF